MGVYLSGNFQKLKHLILVMGGYLALDQRRGLHGKETVV